MNPSIRFSKVSRPDRDAKPKRFARGCNLEWASVSAVAVANRWG